MEDEKKNLVVLTADDILQGKPVLDQEEVELSGNRAVYVREMTGTEKNKWELACMKKTPAIGNQKAGMEVNLTNYYMKVVVFTVCDEHGNRLFDNSWLLPKKLEQLGDQFRSSDVEAIVTVANRISKITPEDQEELLGNSEAETATDSDSGSV